MTFDAGETEKHENVATIVFLDKPATCAEKHHSFESASTATKFGKHIDRVVNIAKARQARHECTGTLRTQNVAVVFFCRILVVAKILQIKLRIKFHYVLMV
jgi:hypothetical protein